MNVEDLFNLGIERHQAHELDSFIRDHARGERRQEGIDEALELANKMMDAHGVEAIQGNWVNGYYGHTVALYVNTGETYDTTLLFDTSTGKFHVMSWGDWVEKYGDERGVQ